MTETRSRLKVHLAIKSAPIKTTIAHLLGVADKVRHREVVVVGCPEDADLVVAGNLLDIDKSGDKPRAFVNENWVPVVLQQDVIEFSPNKTLLEDLTRFVQRAS